MAIIDQFKRNKKTKAQTLVEFALVMPILMLVIVGLLEVGRLVFLDSIVISAAREGARYGSATGSISGTTQYKDCAAIREAAKRVDPLGVITDANIVITYDHGPGTAVFGPCSSSVSATGGDRILVKVSVPYVPLAGMIPLTAKTLSSMSERTLLGQVKLSTTPLPPSADFTLYVDITGTGEVSSSPAGINNCTSSCSAVYAKDTVVDLTPSATFPNQFDSWSGACSGSGGCTVTLNASKSVRATFKSQIQHTLTIVRDGTGATAATTIINKVVSDPPGIDCGDICTYSFDEGSIATITGIVGFGYRFDGWSGGGGCLGTAPCAVTMMSDITVHATYTTMPDQILTVSLNGTGTGTVTSSPAGINCGATCTATYPYGTKVTLTATPTSPSIAGVWGNACTGTDSNVCILTMTAAKTATAGFLQPVCNVKHSGPIPNAQHVQADYLADWTIYNYTPNAVVSSIKVHWLVADLITLDLAGYKPAILQGSPDVTCPSAACTFSQKILPNGQSVLTLSFSKKGANGIVVTMWFNDPICGGQSINSEDGNIGP